MLRPRWRKVLRDLWLNKTRTLLVVLSIAVGVFAVGAIASSQVILSRDLTQAYLATNPASATFFTFDSFGDSVVQAVENMPEVKEAEGRRRVTVRVQTGPEEFRLLYLIAIPDFDEVEIDKFQPEAGAWPPPDNQVLIERASLNLLQAELGDTLLVKTPEGKERQMHIAGLAHDLNAQIYVFDGTSYGFITTNTLEWLGQPSDYNELRIIVADHADDRNHIREVASRVQDKIEDGGRTVLFTLIPEPGKSPLDFLIQAISILMGALAVMSLLLSGFLVINTISALLAQQVRQIGIMKAVGARTRQVTAMYLLTVTILGLLALFLAIPTGIIGAYFFTRFIASFLNFDLTTFQLPSEVLLAEIAVGLVAPILAGLCRRKLRPIREQGQGLLDVWAEVFKRIITHSRRARDETEAAQRFAGLAHPQADCPKTCQGVQPEAPAVAFQGQLELFAEMIARRRQIVFAHGSPSQVAEDFCDHQPDPAAARDPKRFIQIDPGAVRPAILELDGAHVFVGDRLAA